MATIFIDGKPYEAKEGENLLQAVLSQRLDLPYFCWHPSMGSIGACRQCAVIQFADEEDAQGRLQMACMTSVADGMRLSIEAAQAKEFRAAVIEWLMENHPHDCPVCEEGGECHLQDMTVMTGHSVRRYRGPKRTWQNQDLGPFIGHEMNRCITCYRCVRFYDEYAGGTDLSAFGSRSRMFFGRFKDGTLESEFSGNLVEVCPTGVFTDKPFAEHYTRKWDLQTAPSICPGCSVGCNIFPAERYGRLKRITNRYHSEINGYFLCDKGRFGSHFTYSEDRILNAGVRNEQAEHEYGDSSRAIDVAAELSADAIGIGSPRASLENNFALRELVGVENFCAGFSDTEQRLLETALAVYRSGKFQIPSVKEVEEADAILVLGEDVSNTAARVALAVRQAARGKSFEMAEGAAIPDWQDAGVRKHAQHEKSPIFVATPASTRLDDVAAATFSGDSDAIVDVSRDIAALIAGEADDSSVSAFAKDAVEALQTASNPLLITGVSLGDERILQAAGTIANSLATDSSKSGLLIVGGEANSFGSALLGSTLSMSDALQRMTDGAAAIVLENDLSRRAEYGRVENALMPGNHVVVDVLETAVTEGASVVLPAAAYAEQTGTFVNYETRAQRFYQVYEPEREIAPAWQWISSIARRVGKNSAVWSDYNALLNSCAKATFGELLSIAPGPEFRLDGESRIPRQPHRYSGRTAMRADVDVHEPKTTVDLETPFSFSMEGQNPGDQDGATVPYVWSPGWNSNQSVFKFQQEVAGALRGGDPGVRLLTPNQENGEAEPRAVEAETAPASNGDGKHRVVPVPTIFGSEELSAQSWPIKARMSMPYVLLAAEDAESLAITDGAGVKVEGLSESVEVRVDTRLPSGLIGVPTGYDVANFSLPDRTSVTVDEDFVRRPGIDAEVIAKG